MWLGQDFFFFFFFSGHTKMPITCSNQPLYEEGGGTDPQKEATGRCIKGWEHTGRRGPDLKSKKRRN